MQIDESRLPSGEHDLAKELRHLEFDLRDIAESMFTRTVRIAIFRVGHVVPRSSLEYIIFVQDKTVEKGESV